MADDVAAAIDAHPGVADDLTDAHDDHLLPVAESALSHPGVDSGPSDHPGVDSGHLRPKEPLMVSGTAGGIFNLRFMRAVQPLYDLHMGTEVRGGEWGGVWVSGW